MKKKILALLVITIMLLSLTPQMALAATTHAVTNGETLNIETGVLTHADSTTETLAIANGDTISVAAGAAATITGSKNVMIDCGAGVVLTLDDVTIDVNTTRYACALSFTGSGNTLTLAGTNTLKSSKNFPGVRVEGTTALEIAGDGSLDVTGGESAAGIGSGPELTAGTIRIGGNARVTATGGAGIETTTASLNGIPGYVTNDADMNGGAGIGGGAGCGNGGVTTIEGTAHVTAMGSFQSAGIGGGAGGIGGTINIRGGVVYAVRGQDGTTRGNDIGCGAGVSGGAGQYIGRRGGVPRHQHDKPISGNIDAYALYIYTRH